MQRSDSGLPFLIGGLVLAAILILVTFQSGPNQQVLNRQFAPRPVDPSAPTVPPFELPVVSLPDLPGDMQTRISDLSEQFAGGQPVPALTPTSGGQNVQVRVSEVRRSGEQVSVRGQVANIGTQHLRIDPQAFSFRDSSGISYAIDGSGATALGPGEEISFDLDVPLPAGRGLTLIVDVPPDPPLDLDLIVELKQ
jgi:cold shock CspA family protein